MTNPYRHPISTPVPQLQGIGTIASSDSRAGAVIPAGWMLVPMSPTQAMVDAWADARAPRDLIRGAPDDEANRLMATSDWSAMLASAPTPPVADAAMANAPAPASRIATDKEAKTRDARFLQAGFDKQLAHLVEECGEVLAAAGKTQRWGPRSVNPLLPPDQQEANIDWLMREIGDLANAIDRLRATVEMGDTA
jgi:NTP pyrophosphatase (non-canonical NTP hydrolase)